MEAIVFVDENAITALRQRILFLPQAIDYIYQRCRTLTLKLSFPPSEPSSVTTMASLPGWKPFQCLR